MRVLWTVSGYVLGERSRWSAQEAKAFLFKPLDITRSEIIFDGRACRGVRFRREEVPAADYLGTAWRVTPQELGIEDREVQVVKTNCDLPGFQEYVRLSDGRLVIHISGAFFFFDPAVTR